MSGIAQYDRTSLPAGQLIDSVYVNSSTDESFALYLPGNYYNKTQKWPVIFFFDPAARGSYTLLKYKNIAEHYELIMVCSNNCRNGQIPVMEKLAKNMFEAVFGRLQIDHEHIYLSGFSGGARLSISLIQNLTFNVRAVIGCGAGFPANRSIDTDFPFAYVTLTSTRDGNFNELYSNKSFFDNKRMNHPIFLFEGGHTWPPEEHFEEAVLWLLLNDNMLDNNTVEKIYVDISERIKSTMSASDYLQAYYLVDAFSKLPVENQKHNVFHSLYQKIISNPGYLQEYQELNKVLKKEREIHRINKSFHILELFIIFVLIKIMNETKI